VKTVAGLVAGLLAGSTVVPSEAAGAYLIRTIAGRGVGDGRLATAAALAYPSGVAHLPDGTLLVADRLHHKVRHVDGEGVISTLAGVRQGILGDGLPAHQVELKEPLHVRPLPDGRLLIAEYAAHRVRLVEADGNVRTLAGVVDQIGDGPVGGPATACKLEYPADAVADAAGNVYIADDHQLRRQRLRRAQRRRRAGDRREDGRAGGARVRRRRLAARG
jgi:hypothetical protein